MPTLLEQAEQRISDNIKQASLHFAYDFKTPMVNTHQRGKIAGSAHLQKNLIKLNKVLFEENPAHFFSDVIPHEVAHIVCYQYFGKVKPHGNEWKMVMTQVFNLKALVTHSLNVDNVGLKHFDYRCACDTKIKLSSIRHNRIQQGKRQYRCSTCKQELIAVDSV
ncbi:SprT family zinc-dependent metalloprotease [Glaciecola sp. MH2013]|uniref:SprT family zinc-dependent metalloprotease n=1 Tax=Glaciecola sp. MH2013 TaxID=2785524 RepID=UPI00189CBB7F|nr:SprT family zinc-dependent metalloprotease [Glaciecola sp. MH2013]MBF7072585.1 SprT family zinc-dependent metalloprotease [Glaciecola sp. MH2013]